MTANLPKISYENGLNRSNASSDDRVSYYSVWLLWECMARNGNCTIDNCWRSSVACSLRQRCGFLKKQPPDDDLGLSRVRMIYRWWVYFDWDGLPSKEVGVDAFRTRCLAGMDCHQRRLKLMQSGQGRYNRVRQVSSWGKPPPLKEGDHDDNGSWCEPWGRVECTGWRTGIYNTLPDHHEMTAWWIKSAGSKVEIGPWNALGRTRSDGMIHVIRPIIPANWKRQDTYDMCVHGNSLIRILNYKSAIDSPSMSFISHLWIISSRSSLSSLSAVCSLHT